MSIVSLLKCDSYESSGLEMAVRRAVALVGGIDLFVRPGQRVLIKPNLLAADTPDRRITTDPAVIRVITRMVLEAGGIPFIADSPALDRFKRVAAITGVGAVADELGVELTELTTPIRTAAPGNAVFKSLELAERVLKADVVINIPKVKTHAQMLLTLGVKNLFGTVVSQRKAEWHAMIGVDRDAFASLLIDIHQTVNPSLTVLDGIWGMDGRGPANGNPKFCGFIAASTEALALDMIVCRVLGAPLKRFPLYRAAIARNLIASDLAGIETVGDAERELMVSDFSLPKLEALSVLPPFLTNLAGRYLVSKPCQRPNYCIACKKCTEICASQAIVLNDKRRLIFDYDRCIRCYCCQEVCPQNAIDFKHGPIVRVLNMFGR